MEPQRCARHAGWCCCWSAPPPSGPGYQSGPGRPVTVAIQVLQFVPPEITVPVGTRVAWVNDGGRHQIVADDDSFKSPQLTTAQQKFAYQFRRPGVFPYHCFFHGGAGGKGMAGVVTVVERTP